MGIPDVVVRGNKALLFPLKEGLRQPDSVFEAGYIQRASVFHQKKDPTVPEPVFHSHFQRDVIVSLFFHYLCFSTIEDKRQLITGPW